MDPDGEGYRELYGLVQRAVDWPSVLLPGMTLAVDLRMQSCSDWNHSTVAQQCIQSAVADAVRAKGQPKPLRPSRDEQASLQLYVTMFKDEVKVYRDVSGASLHRRGYRHTVHKAALNEAAAAGALYLAGWPAIAENGGVLVDCMCGSGTLLVEAALMAHNVAPGLLRNEWSLTGWHDFDRRAWQEAVDAARAECRRQWPGVIAGNDVHAGALALAKRSIELAKVEGSVRLHQGSCEAWTLPARPSLVVTNPPWGRRLAAQRGPRLDDANERDSELDEAWSNLRTFLKEQCPGTTAWILNGNPQASRALRMKVSRKIPITLSGVDCRLLKYEIL